MSATHEDGQGTRPQPVRSTPATGTARAYGIDARAPIRRKPVKKTYGRSPHPQHAYQETKFERERRERREAEGTQ